MSSSLGKSASKSASVQTIVFAEIIWAVLALLFFLLFSVSDPGKDRESWYLLGTAVFEIVAFLSAAVLCLRNWLSPQIVSGRKVWLGIGLGMLFYALGTILFTVWEVVFHQEPDVSPGDFFYILAYICLGWGMVMAFASRRLNLELWQWMIVSGIAAVNIALVTWITIAGNAQTVPQVDLFGIAPAAAQPAPIKVPQKPGVASPQPSVQASPKLRVIPTPQLQVSPEPSPASLVTPPIATPAATAAAAQPPAPEWVNAIEAVLSPLKAFVNYFYVIADVFIIIVATTLLLAFWGGRFSQSWRMIAAAAFSLYIADMWLKYATSPLFPGYPNYQSGGLLELFWIFSGVLFGIGAVLEYDLSRSRRAGGRRRA
ncbi:hypothetical protein [Myxacorys almedinensis]|uniref:Uncharacterized protein n=1 Tax=Myxacorys almedinensis A TaxID=2690445 RepID=A0A8J8CM29_9CYAN|nr:hypothetical protein [Myxacorys almedinensis]NDJ18320.1 hypothetical protein [Myxacorys almedinensis A]